MMSTTQDSYEEEVKDVEVKTDIKFDPAGLKGDVTLGINNIWIYLEGVPGSGSCTLTESLTWV